MRVCSGVVCKILQFQGVECHDQYKLVVIQGKSTFRAKALRPDKEPSLETSIFPLSFQVV